MHVRRVKMACGHWDEWLLLGGYSLDHIYLELVATEVCHRCLARELAKETARDIIGNYHRSLCQAASGPHQQAVRQYSGHRRGAEPRKPQARGRVSEPVENSS